MSTWYYNSAIKAVAVMGSGPAELRGPSLKYRDGVASHSTFESKDTESSACFSVEGRHNTRSLFWLRYTAGACARKSLRTDFAGKPNVSQSFSRKALRNDSALQR
jgi:hypothetical protein